MKRSLPEGFLKRWEDGIGKANPKDVKGFEEIYNALVYRGVPADDWFEDAYAYVKRKKDDGSLVGAEDGGNIVGYFIRIVRNWMVYGRGNSGCWQDKVVIRLLESKIKARTTYEVKSILYSLMGEFGSFAVYVAINEVDIDVRNIKKMLKEEVPRKAKKIKKEV